MELPYAIATKHGSLYFSSEDEREGILSTVTLSMKFKQVSCSNTYAMALNADGDLYGYGINIFAQLGLGDTKYRPHLTRIPAITTFLQVSCYDRHTVALSVDGWLWSCGFNLHGQLGLGFNQEIIRTLTKLPSSTQFKYVACGGSHTVALDMDNYLHSTGNNEDGQLGLGDNDNRNRLTKLPSSTQFKYVACGGNHTLALDMDNYLHSTGNNENGQLGLGLYIQNKNELTRVQSSTRFLQVACGDSHTLALDIDNHLHSTGYNEFYQLALGDNYDKNKFTEVDTVKQVKQIACGGNHTIVLTIDNDIYECGEYINKPLTLIQKLNPDEEYILKNCVLSSQV